MSSALPASPVASAIRITAVDGDKDATIDRVLRSLDMAGARGTGPCAASAPATPVTRP